MWTCVIPGFYLFHSRLHATWERASWVVINPAIGACVAFWSSGVSATRFIPLYGVTSLAWISVYEVGYLENDYVTTRREVGATVRLTAREVAALERRYTHITALKCVVAIFLLCCVWLIARSLAVNVELVRFAVLIVISRCVFILHNSIRSRWNLATFFCLQCLKYVAVASLFAVKSWVALIMVAVALVPLPRLMEYASKKRFRFSMWQRLVGDFDSFRPKYYGAALLFWAVAAGLGTRPVPLLALLAAFMLVFRIVAWCAVSRFSIRRQQVAGSARVKQPAILADYRFRVAEDTSAHQAVRPHRIDSPHECS